MPMDAHDIESMIKAAIPDAEVTIRDLAGDGDHYAATVISESFRGKSRVQQHQIVYQSLQGPDGRRAARAGAADRRAGGASASRTASTRGADGADDPRGALFRAHRAEPAQPRHLCRTVLRPGVRVRGHPALAHAARRISRRSARCRSTLLLLAVWWVWIYTSWITNWLDPEQTPVRLMLFALMLGGLVLSTSIPKAFEERGLALRGRLCGDAGRPHAVHAVGADASHEPRQLPQLPAHHRLAGADRRLLDRRRPSPRARRGLRSGRSRSPSNTSRPAVGFWMPGLGRSATADWDVEGGHMAERCALFVIIALGESILVTGATFAELAWTTATIGAFLVGLRRQRRDVVDLLQHRRRARQPSRSQHRAIPAGSRGSPTPICTCRSSPASSSPAVGDELVLHHPGGHTDLKTVISAIGGPLLFLLGNILFKHTMRGSCNCRTASASSRSACSPGSRELSPLALSILTTAIMIVVAAWESISLKSDPRE